ncbi:MAG: hypothetical protein M3680_08740 [Myxococcota bacterium]|nr:hypothetical protein [Myxococcota bacterium]
MSRSSHLAGAALPAAVVLALSAGGCNAVFGIAETATVAPDDAYLIDGDPRVDLDRDDLKDISDPCIAPAADGLVDSDGDGLANRDDPCPFDLGTTDADGDGIGDACDPTPVTGDRVRCVMAFRDPDLNHAMWKQRGPAETWRTTGPGELRALGGSSSIVADWPFEAAVVTAYDVRGSYVGKVPDFSRFSVIVRAGPLPADGEVACSLVTAGRIPATLMLVLSTPDAKRQADLPAMLENTHFKLVTAIAPASAGGGSLVGCRAVVVSSADFAVTTTLLASLPLPEGRLAFSVQDANVVLHSLTVYERDDVP